MIATARSLSTAALGASLIATAAVAPVQVATPRLSQAAVTLQASIFDIFTFPALQQSIANEVEFVAIRAAGLAESGVGLAESFAALPETLITVLQQTFSGDVLGALTTIEDFGIAAAEATLIPYIAAQIDVGQIQLAIDSALLPARPIALVELGGGLFTAFDTVARAIITAGQNIVQAVLSFNIGDIVQAVVDGVGEVIGSFATGGQAAVDGIVAAQTTIATALAARPAPVALDSGEVAAPEAASGPAPAAAASRSAAARTAPAAAAPAPEAGSDLAAGARAAAKAGATVTSEATGAAGATEAAGASEAAERRATRAEQRPSTASGPADAETDRNTVREHRAASRGAA